MRIENETRVRYNDQLSRDRVTVYDRTVACLLIVFNFASIAVNFSRCRMMMTSKGNK